MNFKYFKFLGIIALVFFAKNLIGNNGLLPEVIDLNAKDISFQKEKEIPILKNHSLAHLQKL